MIYLLDANTLINAERDYYPIEQVPQFWEWLQYQASKNVIKQPQETYEEVIKGSKDREKDPLLDWLKCDEVKKHLVLDEEVDERLVQKIVSDGYAPDLTDSEVEEIGQDPFLIAYALADLGNRTVVTAEVSKPRAQRQNRHVPDVCDGFKVPVYNLFQLNRALKFSTNWNK